MEMVILSTTNVPLGTMEWVELSDHIISLGMLRNDRSFKNVIKSYHPSEQILDREKHES